MAVRAQAALVVWIVLISWTDHAFGGDEGRLSGTVSAPTTEPCRVRSASDSPRGLMHRFQQAYECGDLEAYSLLFTQDFRFVSNDPDFIADHPTGMNRDEEIASARHLFEGFTRADGGHLPVAVKIELQIDPLRVTLDSEVRGRPESYQLVTVGAVQLAIDQGGGAEIITIGDRHEFHLVRGEVAELDANQRGDADHWYIRTWVEHVPLHPNWGAIRSLYR